MNRLVPAIFITGVLAAAITVIAGCGERRPDAPSRSATVSPASDNAEAPTPSGTAPKSVQPSDALIDLHDIEGLQTLFNEDDGIPRVILLFSPT